MVTSPPGRVLVEENAVQSANKSVEDNIDVPEEEDAILEQLFGALQDRVCLRLILFGLSSVYFQDTVVRWSAAKGVARISERLPSEFAEQVLETILGLYSIHSAAIASLYDVPPIAESTWHGACLSCAEIARRGLVPSDKLPDLVQWLSKVSIVVMTPGDHMLKV